MTLLQFFPMGYLIIIQMILLQEVIDTIPNCPSMRHLKVNLKFKYSAILYVINSQVYLSVCLLLCLSVSCSLWWLSGYCLLPQGVWLPCPLHRRVQHESAGQAKASGKVVECTGHPTLVCTTQRIFCLRLTRLGSTRPPAFNKT
jgi:hypothetical protein